MAGGRYSFPYGPSPTDESLKLKAKYAAEYKATGQWKPPEQCSDIIRDPAIERFGWIRENPDLYFKWKPRSVRNAVIFCLMIPGAILLFAKTQENAVQMGFGVSSLVSLPSEAIAMTTKPQKSM